MFVARVVPYGEPGSGVSAPELIAKPVIVLVAGSGAYKKLVEESMVSDARPLLTGKGVATGVKVPELTVNA